MSFLRRNNTRQANSVSPGVSPTPTPSGRTPSPDGIWENLDLSSTEYARTRKELMQLINDLRSLGAETLIDLPTIVVIGGQSAGKSSLVEAVSGVNVPRDSGTCTRCPMECTMSSSATTWSCKIKLRFDYDSFGQSTDSTDREVTFGPTITDKNEVDLWLRRAQAAILNPNSPPANFHQMTVPELRNFSSPATLKFSRNVVSIIIEDPTSTDLSFVDLPGLIQNEEAEVVELVRQLTESYISRPNTIILTTIPMSDDMQNQQSVTLARKADPEGERTIGILTKPDMLGDGAVNSKQQWLDVIEGRNHILMHGYYCVRLPDDAQRAQRLSRAALQRTATEYFDTTSPWNEVADRGRFGIPAFVTDISVLLVSHIRRLIPQLKQDVERLLAECLEEIGTLPKPLETDPQIEVLVRVNAFCDAFKSAVSGTSSDKSLAQRNRALYNIFAKEIRGTSPDFRPFEEPEKYMRIDTLDSEEDHEVQDHRVQTMGVYDVRKTIKEATGWELPGNIPYEAKTRLIHRFTDLWPTPAEKCLRSINDVLDDVIQQLVMEQFGRFKVLHDLISDLIRPDIEEHKGRVRDAVKETLELEINPIYTQNETDFENLRGRWLAEYGRARRNPLEYLIREGVDTLDWFPPYPPPSPRPASPPACPPACPTDYPTACPTAPRPAHKKRQKCSIPAVEQNGNKPCEFGVLGSPEQQALNYLAEAGYKGLTVDDLARLCPRDHFGEELTIMADVRAYFTIACKRVIDHVSLKIEHSLYQALADSLKVSLLQRLLVSTTATGNFADRMKELVSDDPATVAKRTHLEGRHSRLQEMRKKLLNFAA